ncbi:MAG: hypothetical protein M3312_00895 [Actinomycetota bacterium]|nr:hypothetical protein [Actinomycetota bacterium]
MRNREVLGLVLATAAALFWASRALAVAWAFVFPLNRWLVARGRGHAVVHRHHH